MPEIIKVLMICHGNICRSTMAQSVFENMVRGVGRQDEFEIDSAATSYEEIGNGVHRGTVEKLKSVGIPVVPHRARRMTKEDYDHYDFLIGMDSANINNMKRIAGGDPDGKIFSLMEFAGSDRSIADPWYTGNFDETYEDICEGLEAFMREVDSRG